MSRQSRITKQDLEIVYLHYEKGMSVSKIARELGITKGSVKYRLHDKPKVKQYVKEVVIPDIERKIAERTQQIKEELASTGPKR